MGRLFWDYFRKWSLENLLPIEFLSAVSLRFHENHLSVWVASGTVSSQNVIYWLTRLRSPEIDWLQVWLASEFKQYLQDESCLVHFNLSLQDAARCLQYLNTLKTLTAEGDRPFSSGSSDSPVLFSDWTCLGQLEPIMACRSDNLVWQLAGA